MGAFSEYAPGEDLPLVPYAALLATYGLGLAGLIEADRRGRVRLPERPEARDLVLLVLATHKVTRILARATVTAPLRAPFTSFEQRAGDGEVEERPRAGGWRKALGGLLACNFCLGPWVATGLWTALAVRPSAARAVMSVFAGVAGSDFLHRTYLLLQDAHSMARARSEVAAETAQSIRSSRTAERSDATDFATR